MILNSTIGKQQKVVPLTINTNGIYEKPNDSVYGTITANVRQLDSLNDIIYIDSDGSILYNFTKEEFMALTEEPVLPTKEGLVAEGWNWSLTEAQTALSGIRPTLTIGVTYNTNDNNTKIYIEISENARTPSLGLGVNGTCTINWGDGTSNVISGSDLATIVNTSHTYSSAGSYIITLVPEGTIRIFGTSNVGSYLFWKKVVDTYRENRLYQNCVKKIHLGSNVEIGEYAFSTLYHLTEITIPNGITTIETYAFQNCYCLSSLVIPKSVISLGTNTFSNVKFRILSVSSKTNDLANNYTLASQTLQRVDIPEDTTTLGAYMFASNLSLTEIYLPDSISSLGDRTFNLCSSLKKVNIPAQVTAIPAYAFYQCFSLQEIVIPANITTINAASFFYCYSLSKIEFLSKTPPTLISTNVFSELNSDCIIYVPKGSLETYTAATNYPDPTVWTYKERGE